MDTPQLRFWRAACFVLLSTVMPSGVEAGTPPPVEEALVDVPSLIPDAVLDLRYATENNFLKARVYPVSRCLLRKSVAERLARAQDRLRRRGYRVRLYDCYRPLSVQKKMWKLFPQPGYVADPAKGSNHNRGAAVDLGLVTLEGREVEMPTEFDTFDPKAHASAVDGVSAIARKHRQILADAMEEQGFEENPMEWWHFDAWDHDRFSVLDIPLDTVP